jgi:ribose transport system substrate-binding protein
MIGARAIVGGAMLAAAAGAVPATATEVKVALVSGGPHPYFASWEDGGRDAAKAFGVAAADFRVPANWELSAQNQMIENLTAQGYNAFLIFPGDAVATNGPMADLQSAGIPSIATAGCTKDPTPALFCFGTDTGRSAYLGTRELIKAIGGKGNIVHFTGELIDPNTKLRMDAVDQAIAETTGSVHLLQTVADIDSTPQLADEKINALLAARGNEVDGIIATAWLPSVSAAIALRRIGDKRIQMVGIDHDPVLLAAIKDGFVHGTMLQNPYGQAYVGTYVMEEIVGHGCKVNDEAPFETIALTKRFIDSGTAFQGIDGVDTYQNAMKAVTAELMKTFKAKYLICP